MPSIELKAREIYDLLLKVVRGDYTERDLVRTVDVFQKVALSYLRYLQVLGKRVAGDSDDLGSELEDLALDCVAPLFRRDKQGRFVILRAYFGESLKGYDPEQPLQVLADLRRLVVKKTKQELSRIFRERDPEGARLLRNIRVAVRNSEDLHIFREAGRDWLCLREHAVAELEREMQAVAGTLPSEEQPKEGLRRTLPPISERELRHRFLAVHSARDPVPVSLRKLLRIVEEAEEFQNCIPVEVAARVIRETHTRLMYSHVQARSVSGTPFEFLQEREIQEAVAAVDAFLWEKLKRYVWRRKLSLNTAEAYRYALRDVVLDELDRHRRLSYFKQLKHYLPTLDYHDYRRNHRSVFEYLAKLGRKQLAARVRKMV